MVKDTRHAVEVEECKIPSQKTSVFSKDLIQTFKSIKLFLLAPTGFLFDPTQQDGIWIPLKKPVY